MNDDAHVSGLAEWNYIGVDENPPLGKKVNLLTKGFIQVTGHYIDDGSFIAWAPLIKRNKKKEAIQKTLDLLKRQRQELESSFDTPKEPDELPLNVTFLGTKVTSVPSDSLPSFNNPAGLTFPYYEVMFGLSTSYQHKRPQVPFILAPSDVETVVLPLIINGLRYRAKMCVSSRTRECLSISTELHDIRNPKMIAHILESSGVLTSK